MSVTFRNQMPKPIQTLTVKLKKGEYVYSPTAKCPILITESGRGRVYGARLDNGNVVELQDSHYEVIELEITFRPDSEG